MITLIRNVDLYSPEPMGRQDLLFAAGKVLAIGKNLNIQGEQVEVLDGSDMILIPGLVDPLAHITGGGGEGGFHTRTPAMEFTEASLYGVTTLVGCLGTDSVSRTLEDLLARAKGLKNEGLNVYCYTGSYAFPVKTLTGDIERDLLLVDEVIGVGEIAIADHRGSQLSACELARVAAQCRVGGMLSGKAGIVFVHVGDGKTGLNILHQVAEQSDIPLTQFYPTHINRSQRVLDEGIAFARAGGMIDFTTSTNESCLASGEVPVVDAIRQAIEAGVSPDNISLSSDGNASLPVFNDKGELVSLEVGRVGSLFEALADCLNAKMSLGDVLPMFTRNAARTLKLKGKGVIEVGGDADMVLLNKEFAIQSVWSRGRQLVAEGKPVVRGTFQAN
ncbi:beta-aspartyl-peptidase [Shewanella submarina]|uniref:Isoaspartyl dipeptidase n=1 Tax=Shewanella submarina TaxID=2016376 RepID=A0ABV7GJD1_9GAMM|nr:beta-aspartyl-peptidase [Shewanella submarina]MCL1036064.1 beta-aspartyl-peptidase [Shewanella submarina]